MSAARPCLRLALASMLLLAAFGPFAAPVPRQLAEEAEQAVNKGDYPTALKCYEEIVKQAPYDPNVLYNLGTIHARMGERGRATWRYLQALTIAPRDASLLHNLRLVDPDFEQNVGRTPLPPLNAFYWRLTANEWTALAAAATLSGLLLLVLFHWLEPRRAMRPRLRRLALICFLAAGLAWVPALMRYYQEEVQWRGVVVADGTAAHIDPSDRAYENFTLPSGKIVRVLDQPTPDWLKVAFDGGSVGYVPRERIEFL